MFRAHAAHYEKLFFADLDALGVRPPHAIPRITDHMPQIISFIEKLEDTGFAYAGGAGGANGEARSVYFDVSAFRNAGHVYGKLEPWKVGTAELASEGESNFAAREKRSDQVHKWAVLYTSTCIKDPVMFHVPDQALPSVALVRALCVCEARSLWVWLLEALAMFSVHSK